MKLFKKQKTEITQDNTEQPAAEILVLPKMKHLDNVSGARALARVWRSVAIFGLISTSILAVANGILIKKNLDAADNVKYIIAPGPQTLDIVRPGELPESYIKAAFNHVVQNLASWNHQTIEDNYKELFENFYTLDLASRTKTALLSSNRMQTVAENKMTSTFKIDDSKSQYTWCNKLSKPQACGIVVGTENLYIDNNIPYKEKETAFLIFSQNIAPTRTNFFAIRVTRLLIGSSESLKPQFDAALKGTLPNEK